MALRGTASRARPAGAPPRAFGAWRTAGGLSPRDDSIHTLSKEDVSPKRDVSRGPVPPYNVL